MNDKRFSKDFRDLVVLELLELYENKADELYKKKIKDIKSCIKSNSKIIGELSRDNLSGLGEIEATEYKIEKLRQLK